MSWKHRRGIESKEGTRIRTSTSTRARTRGKMETRMKAREREQETATTRVRVIHVRSLCRSIALSADRARRCVLPPLSLSLLLSHLSFVSFLSFVSLFFSFYFIPSTLFFHFLSLTSVLAHSFAVHPRSLLGVPHTRADVPTSSDINNTQESPTPSP